MRALLRMVDELTTKLAITNLCIVWDAEYPREAELLTECRRQEERAERAEEALSDKAHLLKAFALLKDRVKVLEADLETANHWRHKANEALDGQANRANKIEKERDDLRAKLADETECRASAEKCWAQERILREALEAKLAEAEKDFVDHLNQWTTQFHAVSERAEAAEARVRELEETLDMHRSVCGA